MSVMSLENRPVRIKVQDVNRREKERGTWVEARSTRVISRYLQ